MKKRILAWLLTLILLVMPMAAFAATSETARESVVRLYVEHEFGVFEQGSEEPTGYAYLSSVGSGFAVGKSGKSVEYFVTNAHVIGTQAELEAVMNQKVGEGKVAVLIKTTPYIILTNVHEKIPVNVVYISDRTDLAIVQSATPITTRKPASIRAFDEKGINGEDVFALGFPADADLVFTMSAEEQLYSDVNLVSKSSGIVGRLISHGQTGSGEQLQIDVPIIAGNSGGPLVDEKGHVVGVNTQGLPTADVNFAVSSNEVIRMLEQEKIQFIKAGGFDVSQIALIVLLVFIVAVLIMLIQQKKKASAPKRYLVGNAGHFAGKRVELKIKTAMVAGRQVGKCQILFPDKTAGVSGVHCTIRFDGKAVMVTDHSSRGTMIDGKKIPSGQTVVLHRGQQLQLGSDEQSFTLQS